MACDSRSKKPRRDILRLCECSFIQNFQIPVPATGERNSQILYSYIYKTDLTKQTCEFFFTVRRLLGLFPSVDFSRGGWPQNGTIVHHLEQCLKKARLFTTSNNASKRQDCPPPRTVCNVHAPFKPCRCLFLGAHPRRAFSWPFCPLSQHPA